MSYCLNPDCPDPADQKTPDPSRAKFCSNCGSPLRLSDRYRTLRLMGQGSFGRTFLAIDEHKPSHPPCILKQLVGISGQEIEAEESTLFRQEALRLEKLGQHPQIPTLMAFFEQDGHRYLVQEYIDGISLEQQLQEQGAFSEMQIRAILNETLPILQFVHIQQIIHRDIKTQNIIRVTNPIGDSATNALFLVDFGTAKFATTSNILQVGTKISGRGYGPPELAAGRATFSSDLYDLGVTCIRLLTHEPLSNLFDRRKHRWDWKPLLKQPISDGLAHVLNRMIEQELRQRYKTANEVVDNLNKNPSGIGDRPTFVPAPAKRNRMLRSDRQLDSSSDCSTDSTDSSNSWECVHVLRGHQAWVRSVALSADSKLLVSGSGDKTVRIWSTARGQLLHTLTGHTSWVRAINISPDQRLIASAGNDKAIRLWHLQTGVHQQTLTGHQDSIRAIEFLPLHDQSVAYTLGATLVTGGQDKLIHLWNIRHKTILRTFSGHEHWVLTLAVHPNGQILYSGSRDRTIRQWDLASGRCLATLSGHTAEVTGLAVSPNGTILVSCSADQTIRIWDVASNQLKQTLQGHNGAINSVAFHPGGKEFASGSNDKSIKLWSSEGKEIATLSGHAGWIWTVAFPLEQPSAHSNMTLASGCWDGAVHVWQRSP